MIAEIFKQQAAAHNEYGQLVTLEHMWQTRVKFPEMRVDLQKSMLGELYGTRFSLSLVFLLFCFFFFSNFFHNPF